MKINCPKCQKETEFFVNNSISEDGEVFRCQHCGWPFRYVFDHIKKVDDAYIKKFKNALHKGILEFEYKKKNGETRIAHGTLNNEFIGEENLPKGTGYEISDNVIRYFDTDSNGWRSFLVENFVDWKS